MFDDDADLIEQVSDDEDENMEVDHRRGRHGGLEEEPALEGYERYEVTLTAVSFLFDDIRSDLTVLASFRTEMLGQGAYGIVYKGRKLESNDIVAIKRIPFTDSTPEGGVPCNVIREISLLRELDHPNVVSEHGLWGFYTCLPVFVLSSLTVFFSLDPGKTL